MGKTRHEHKRNQSLSTERTENEYILVYRQREKKKKFRFGNRGLGTHNHGSCVAFVLTVNRHKRAHRRSSEIAANELIKIEQLN